MDKERLARLVKEAWERGIVEFTPRVLWRLQMYKLGKSEILLLLSDEERFIILDTYLSNRSSLINTLLVRSTSIEWMLVKLEVFLLNPPIVIVFHIHRLRNLYYYTRL